MRRLAPLMLVAALTSPRAVYALGLGELALQSFLNEPLRAEVELLELGDLDPSQIKIRLATREDFSRAGVERDYFLTSLRFAVVGQEDAKLVITSTEPVREPYLDFIVEARWPSGRLLREYTVLLDPPVFAGSERGVTARASSREAPQRQREQREEQQRRGAESSVTGARPSPSRSFGAGTSDTPTSGERYLVRRDDTLWSIAQAARPRDATVQQTMLDIQRLNPQAFIGGNINRLKAGYVLDLPTADEISPRAPEQAVAEVAAQMARWQRGVSDTRTRIDASEPEDLSASAGSARGEGHLQIAAAEDEAVESGEGGVSARMEDLDRVERENRDLATRLGSLEQQIQMQDRLIALKEEQIAALQNALVQADSEVPDTSQMEGAVQSGQAEFAETEEAEAPVIENIPDAPERAAAAQVEQPQVPASRPVAPPPPAPSFLDMLLDNILYVGAGLLLLLLTALYFLRDRLPGLNRHGDQQLPARGAADDEDEFAGVRLSDDSLIVDEFAEDSDPAARAIEGISTLPAPEEEAYAAQFESGDALAEADIYIAYGRFPQAVDLLKAAIAVEPVNTDYRIKLMEASVEMVDREEYQQQYADLQVIGDENLLARARGLLDAVDGGDLWLEDLPHPTITPADVEAARAAAAGSSNEGPQSLAESGTALDELGEFEEAQLDLEEEDLDLDLDLDLPMDSASLDSGELDSIEFEDTLLQSGDELDDLEETSSESFMEKAVKREGFESATAAGAAAVAGLGAAESSDTHPSAQELPDVALDSSSAEDLGAHDERFEELELESDAGEFGANLELPDSLEFDESESDAAGSDDLLADLGDLGLDLEEEGTRFAETQSDIGELDLSLEDTEEDSLQDLAGGFELGGGDRRSAEAGELDLGELNDDFSLETGEPTPETASGGLADDTLDLSDFDMDRELNAPEIAPGDSHADLQDLELDVSTDEEEDLLFAVNGDEVATKLDLARAYIDMGDHEGARSILSEVIEEGSDTQKAEAHTLLGGID
jgi:pilus assembly protein FimV